MARALCHAFRDNFYIAGGWRPARDEQLGEVAKITRVRYLPGRWDTPHTALFETTAYSGFKVDPDGFQIAHKMVVFQWQDGNKVIVWPEELALGKPRLPTPPWSQR